MAALSAGMHITTKTLLAFTLTTALVSTAQAQDSQGAGTLSASTGPAPAPVVVPVSNTHQQQQVQQQAQQQPVQQQQVQQPVQQAPYPQQAGWGYQYRPPTQQAYPGTAVGGVQYGYQQPTPQYHFEDQERATRSLYVPGLILFGVGWIGNFAILTPLANALSTDDTRDPAAQEDSWAWSLVPVIGPVVQLAIGAPHPAIPIMTGLMQIGGLALFIAGLLTKETVRVRVLGPPDGSGTTVELDAAPVQGGGVLQMTVSHL